MLSTDQSHLTKYLTTLGVAIFAGTLTLSGLFVQNQDALVLRQDEIDRLSPLAQEVMRQRQQFLHIATDLLPWFLIIGVSVGLLSTLFGLWGWLKRQGTADKLEDLALEKGEFELRLMSDGERINKAEAEAFGEVTDEVAVDAASGGDPNALHESPITSTRARSAMSIAIETEMTLVTKLEDALRQWYRVDLGLEIKRGKERHQVDVVARPHDPKGRWFLFEVKRLSAPSANNMRNRVTDAITQAVVGASMLSSVQVTPIAVVVYDQADPNVVKRAQSHGNALAATFTSRPVLLLLSTSDLEAMPPVTLAARIGASSSQSG